MNPVHLWAQDTRERHRAERPGRIRVLNGEPLHEWRKIRGLVTFLPWRPTAPTSWYDPVEV